MTARGCPKGIRKRTPAEIRNAILGELRNGYRTRSELKETLRLAKNVVYPYIERLVDEGLVASAGKRQAGNGGASPVLYRLREQKALPTADMGVRTTIRGPWPVSAPGRPRT